MHQLAGVGALLTHSALAEDPRVSIGLMFPTGLDLGTTRTEIEILGSAELSDERFCGP
jgi:hypothetical protein